LLLVVAGDREALEETEVGAANVGLVAGVHEGVAGLGGADLLRGYFLY